MIIIVGNIRDEGLMTDVKIEESVKMVYAPHRLSGNLGELYSKIPSLKSEHKKGRKGRKRRNKEYF